jgi:hypothetical protein
MLWNTISHGKRQVTTMIDLNSAFSGIPEPLRTELLKIYNNIVTNYRARRWEPAELNGGKLLRGCLHNPQGRGRQRVSYQATETKEFSSGLS